MASLVEVDDFTPDVYQIETTDLVLGGTSLDQIANLQAQVLANRTLYLKNRLDGVDVDISNIENDVSDLQSDVGILQTDLAALTLKVNRMRPAGGFTQF